MVFLERNEKMKRCATATYVSRSTFILRILLLYQVLLDYNFSF